MNLVYKYFNLSIYLLNLPMKNNKFSFIITLLLFAALPAISFEKKNKNTKIQIYCEHCRQRETCGGKFHKELYNQTGIKNVEIDSKVMVIRIINDTKKIDIQKIGLHVSKLRRDVDGIKANLACQMKLDFCCKKG